MNRTINEQNAMFWFGYLKQKIAQISLLVAKVVTLKQNFYFKSYLQTGSQEKTAHYNSRVEKKSEKRTAK